MQRNEVVSRSRLQILGDSQQGDGDLIPLRPPERRPNPAKTLNLIL